MRFVPPNTRSLPAACGDRAAGSGLPWAGAGSSHRGRALFPEHLCIFQLRDEARGACASGICRKPNVPATPGALRGPQLWLSTIWNVHRFCGLGIGTGSSRDGLSCVCHLVQVWLDLGRGCWPTPGCGLLMELGLPPNMAAKFKSENGGARGWGPRGSHTVMTSPSKSPSSTSTPGSLHGALWTRAPHGQAGSPPSPLFPVADSRPVVWAGSKPGSHPASGRRPPDGASHS